MSAYVQRVHERYLPLAIGNQTFSVTVRYRVDYPVQRHLGPDVRIVSIKRDQGVDVVPLHLTPRQHEQLAEYLVVDEMEID